MSSTKYLKLKKRALIYYSLADQKNYNADSKKNLVQYSSPVCPEDQKKLKKINSVCDVDCINSYTKNYLLTYNEIMKKDYKRTFSVTQQKKISDSTNTFIDAVKFNYRRTNGFKQRMITFVTLTLPENQKHTDKILVKTLVDFIDHLKKVKNTLIEKKQDTGINLLRLQNYIWRAETTEAGNIHFHLLFDTYVNHETLKRVWNNYLEKLGYKGGQNAANIHNLKNISDVGGYVTKYLTKEPLNDEFTKMLKNGTITRDDLKNYDPDVKFRRPVLYVSWGCSRALKTLSAPTFSGSVVNEFNELKQKCAPVQLPEHIADFVKIYKGKIYDLLNGCSRSLKNQVKEKFKYIFSWLYKTDEERNSLSDMAWLSRVNFSIPEIIAPVFQEKQQKFINGTLFN